MDDFFNIMEVMVISFKRLLAASFFLAASLGLSEPLLAMKRKDFLSPTKETSLFPKEQQEALDDLCSICLARCSGKHPERSETVLPAGITLHQNTGSSIELPCGHKFHTTCIFDCIERNPLCPICSDARAGFFAYNTCVDPNADGAVQKTMALRDCYAKTVLKELSKGINGQDKPVNPLRVGDLVTTVAANLDDHDFSAVIRATDKEGRSPIALARLYNDIDPNPIGSKNNIKTIITNVVKQRLAEYPAYWLAHILGDDGAEVQEEKCLMCPNLLSQEGEKCPRLRPDAPHTFALNCTEPFEIDGNVVSKHEYHTTCLINKITDKTGAFNGDSSCECCKKKLPMRDAYNALTQYFKNQNHAHDQLITFNPAEFLKDAQGNNLERVKEHIAKVQSANQQKQLTDDQLLEFAFVQGLGSKMALDFACENNNKSMIATLLNIQFESNNLFFVAIEKGDFRLVKKIINATQLLDQYEKQSIANLFTQTNEYGWNALMLAVDSGNRDIVKLIVDTMAAYWLPDNLDKFIECFTHTNTLGMNVLILAVWVCNLEISQLIVDTMKAHLCPNNRDQFIEWYTQARARGMTALMVVAQSHNPDLVRLIIDTITVCLLPKNPAKCFEWFTQTNQEGDTALTLARLFKNNEEIIELLTNAEAEAEAALKALGQ